MDLQLLVQRSLHSYSDLCTMKPVCSGHCVFCAAWPELSSVVTFHFMFEILLLCCMCSYSQFRQWKVEVLSQDMNESGGVKVR